MLLDEKGKRRSVLEADVQFGELQTPEDALAAWPSDKVRLRRIGRELQADMWEGKLSKMRFPSQSRNDSQEQLPEEPT